MSSTLATHLDEERTIVLSGLDPLLTGEPPAGEPLTGEPPAGRGDPAVAADAGIPARAAAAPAIGAGA